MKKILLFQSMLIAVLVLTGCVGRQGTDIRSTDRGNATDRGNVTNRADSTNRGNITARPDAPNRGNFTPRPDATNIHTGPDDSNVRRGNTTGNSARSYSTNAADAAKPAWRRTADSIIAEGQQYLGTEYVYGSPRFQDKTFDCSSYVQYLYSKHGINLGYNAREQAVEGKEIPFMNLRRGDIMFFSDPENFPNEVGLSKVRHVGIYMGNGKILHTYEPGIGVIISNIHKDEKEGEYWYTHYLFARRVIPG